MTVTPSNPVAGIGELTPFRSYAGSSRMISRCL
ncbi:Uncharacterised protein [Mycobacteroides abscessus subsp. abscessus]|nr:Uncharacterised protein [Mycobacteroides abscessus subsp. abscessus]